MLIRIELKDKCAGESSPTLQAACSPARKLLAPALRGTDSFTPGDDLAPIN